jgi:hypothetical protein
VNYLSIAQAAVEICVALRSLQAAQASGDEEARIHALSTLKFGKPHNCTGVHCLKPTLDVVEVYKHRKRYKQLSRKQQQGFVSQSVNKHMCVLCFLVLHGIKRATWYRIKRKFQQGDFSFNHGNRLLKKPQAETLVAVQWLRAYACAVGDFMPDSDEVHLPDYCWKYVYQRYLTEHVQNSISETTFFRLNKYDGDLRKIKIRKCKRFSKCEPCLELDKLIKNSAGVTRNYWKDAKKKHIEWQMRERMKCAKHVEKATNPATRDEYMVVEIDNMDNQKTAVGQMPRDPKSLASLEKLKTHITGVHVPGDADSPFRCYTWHDRFPTGSDVVITILLRTLCEIAAKGPLPPTLYLHLDNCWRENKNRFVLGITHLLVEAGVFKKVKICFLPVGHTHNIVDQMFSRFSVHIKWNDILTLEDLVRICSGAYQARACKCGKPSRWRVRNKSMDDLKEGCKCAYVSVKFAHLDEMACWGPFLLLHLTSDIRGTSKPRCFRVKRDKEGIVRHHYRAQLQVGKDDVSTRSPEQVSPLQVVQDLGQDLNWMPHNQLGFQLFPDGAPLIESLNLVPVPFKQIDIPALKKTKQALDFHMNDHQKMWWTNRLEAFEEEDRSSCKTCSQLRMDQWMNRVCKNDTDAQTMSEKRSKKKRADDALVEHLNDVSSTHATYPSEFLFPPSRFIWGANGYTDTAFDGLIFNEEEKIMQEQLIAEKEDGIETHFVGTHATDLRLRRSRKNMPPEDIEVGHIVVCKSLDGAEMDGRPLPWYVAEVLEAQEVDSEGKKMLKICEYGSTASGKNIPLLGNAVDPSKIHWQAMFRGKETLGSKIVERDEYRPTANSQYTVRSSAHYEPVCSSVPFESVIWWNEADKIFRKQVKSRKGRVVFNAVISEICTNHRVPWNSQSGPVLFDAVALPSSVNNKRSAPNLSDAKKVKRTKQKN